MMSPTTKQRSPSDARQLIASREVRAGTMALAATAWIACSRPLELPAPPVEATVVRPETAQLGQRYAGPGATIELTLRTSHPVGRGPEVLVAGQPMTCAAIDGTRQAYVCRREVDAEPPLLEGEHGFTFASLSENAPADAALVPVELAPKVVVDRSRPVLATAKLPAVVFENEPFTLVVATTEATDAETPPALTLTTGALEQGSPVRFSSGWQFELTVRGSPEAPVVPADTLVPTADDPAPSIKVRQRDKAGNEAAELEIPLIVRAPGAPRIRLSLVDEQKRPAEGEWVAVTSLRSRIRMEFLADRPIYAWDGATNRELPLQCQPMPPLKLAERDAPSRRVWRGQCLGITPNDWEDDAQPLTGKVSATEAQGGTPWEGTFALQFDLTAPELRRPDHLRIVRNAVGVDDEIATTNGLLRTAATDASRYVSTDVAAGISHLLVYGSAAGGTALVRLPVPAATAPDDAPVTRPLRGTNGVGGALALQRVYVSAVDLFGNESPRVALPDDGAPVVSSALIRLVRTDDLAGDELAGLPGAFNGGSETACPIVRVDVFTEPPGAALSLTGLPRTGDFPAQPLAPAPLRAYVEAVDKAGRVSARTEAANADVAPPEVDAEQLRVRRGAIGEPDVVEWLPGAFDADRGDSSPIVDVRFYDRERGGVPVGAISAPALSRFGAFSPGVTVGTTARGPQQLFVEATDETGLTSARVALPGADLAAPRLVASGFALERRALGLPDRISWDATAAIDASAIAHLRFFESASPSADPIVTWTAPDGAHGLAATTLELPFVERSVRRLFVEADDKTGASSDRVELTALADLSAPQIQVALLAVARRPVGRPDEVELFGDAIDDASAVAKVEFLDAVDGRVLAEVVPAADGTFASVPLGDGSLAPAKVFVRATDKTGLASSVLEVPAGRDTSGPAVDIARFSVARLPVGVHDQIRWSVDAVTDASALVELRFFESAALTDPAFVTWTAPAGGTRLGAGSVDFPETARSPLRVYVEAIDKTGASTGRIQLASTDADPPAIDVTKLSIQRRGVGEPDRVAAVDDAIDDASAVASLELLDAPGGARLALVQPEADGTFAPIDVGTPTRAPSRVYVVATDKTGLASAPVEIAAGGAPSAPVVLPDLTGIARRPLGTPDQAYGQPGALLGPGTPVAVEIFASETATSPLARGSAAVDGSFALTDIGTGTSAPARVHLEALDKTGQRSARVEARLGVDITAPTGDPSVALIVRRALGTPDTVRGALRTCVDANAVALVELAADGTGTALLGTVSPGGDGAFLDVPVGSGTDAPPRVWLRCVDKSGNASAWGEIISGKDIEAPSVNYAQLTFTAVASPGSDQLAGAVGAITDNLSPIRVARVFTTPWADDGVPSIASFTPTAFGSFAAAALGDTAITGVAGVYLEAEDKCGNRNSRAQNRANLYAVNTGPHVPYDFSTPGARLYRVKADVDPRTASPAIGPALWPELDLAGNAAAAAGDDSTIEVTASAELRSVAPTWSRLPAFRSANAKLVFDTATSRFVGIGPGDTNLDVFAWNDTSWVPVTAANAPANRTDFSLAHDAVARRTYLFGGRAGATYFNELWSFDGSEWRLEASGPPARINAGWVHDPDYDRLLLFGGTDAAGAALKDQWSFSAGAWTQESPPATPNDAGLCLVHNPDGRELILLRNDTKLFACGPVGSQPIMETWSLKGQVWTRVSQDPICDYSLSWVSGCLHLPAGSGFGGSNEARVVGLRKSSGTSGTHAILSVPAGARWAALASAGTVDLGSESWSSLAYDAAGRRIMALETYTGGNRAAGRYGGARVLKARGTGLESRMATAGLLVGRRDYMGNVASGDLAWRPRTRELVWGAGRVRDSAPGFSAFLGSGGQWRAEGSLVVSTGTNIVGHFPYADMTWRQTAGTTATATAIPYSTLQATTVPSLPVSGTVYRNAAWNDPLHDGTVVSNSNTGYVLVYRDGSGTASLSNIYTIRVGWAGAFDVGRGKSVVLQGAPTQHWMNSGTLAMVQRSLSVLPPTRTGPGFAYDAGLDRMVLHGGSGLNDTWEWDGTQWIAITTVGAPPATTGSIEFAYDAERGRHLRMSDNDLWEFEHVLPHRRFAAVVGFFPFTSTETLFGMTVRAVAGGNSPAGDGFSVHVWDFTNQRWDLLGSSPARPESPAADRTLRLPVPLAGATRYLRRGAWLLVTANGSSAPTDPSQVSSRLAVDALEFQYLTQVQ